MLKKVALFAALTLSMQLLAQTTMGRQKVDQFNTQSWGAATYGLTWLPTDYDQNPDKSYPLIIFLHGSGEGGTGTGGLWNLIDTGLPQIIAQGWNPEALNPSGVNQKFIVVSPQAPEWSYRFSHIPHILASVQAKYRIDSTRVYVTGISAGGAGAWSVYTNTYEFAQKIAAIVPVSAAGTNTGEEQSRLPLAGANYGGKIWTVCGAADSWMSWANNAASSVNGANPAVPMVVTGIPGADHNASAWNTAYDPNWRNNQLNLNVYEWMLKYSRNGSSTPPPPPTGMSWVAVANEGDIYSVPANTVVRYGTLTQYVERTMSGDFNVANWLFGYPAVGVVKKLYIYK